MGVRVYTQHALSRHDWRVCCSGVRHFRGLSNPCLLWYQQHSAAGSDARIAASKRAIPHAGADAHDGLTDAATIVRLARHHRRRLRLTGVHASAVCTVLTQFRAVGRGIRPHLPPLLCGWLQRLRRAARRELFQICTGLRDSRQSAHPRRHAGTRHTARLPTQLADRSTLQSVFFELSVPGNSEVDVHHIVYEDFFSALGSLAGERRRPRCRA